MKNYIAIGTTTTHTTYRWTPRPIKRLVIPTFNLFFMQENFNLKIKINNQIKTWKLSIILPLNSDSIIARKSLKKSKTLNLIILPYIFNLILTRRSIYAQQRNLNDKKIK